MTNTVAATQIPTGSPVSGPTLLADLNVAYGGWRTQIADDTGVVNGTSAQPWFPTVGGVTLAAATSYLFEGNLELTTGTTSHTTGMSFAGTATLNSIDYLAWIISSAANTISTASSQIWVNVATNIPLNVTSGAVSTIIQVRGLVRVNGAGTFIPQFTFSVAPTAPNTCKRGSFFLIQPLNPVSALATDDRTGAPYVWA